MGEERRKNLRLPEPVYGAGWYFVTICTQNRKNILAQMQPVFVGADDSVRPCGVSPDFSLVLTPEGAVVEECLLRLNDEDAGVCVDSYVIMPNHIHAIICLDGRKGGQSRPPLQRLMQRFKSISTRKLWDMGYTKVWQRSYYDHVIRHNEEYLRIWEYIAENPLKWLDDEYYSP